MRTPFSPLHLLLALLFIAWIVFAVNLELITLSFAKLGLDARSALSLLLTSLAGSAVNLPLLTIKATAPPAPPPPASTFRGLLRPPEEAFTGKTLVAVNVGGCLVPLFFVFFLIRHHPIPLGPLLLAVALVSGVCYVASRPVPGLGVVMPVFIAPIAAAVVAAFLGGKEQAAMAYIAGTLGVLIGADLLRFKDIRGLGAPMASIGGAGTFDGIFMTGLVAVLLAS